MKKFFYFLFPLFLTSCADFWIMLTPEEIEAERRQRADEMETVLDMRCRSFGHQKKTKEYLNCRIKIDYELKKKKIDKQDPSIDEITEMRELFQKDIDNCLSYEVEEGSDPFYSCMLATETVQEKYYDYLREEEWRRESINSIHQLKSSINSSSSSKISCSADSSGDITCD